VNPWPWGVETELQKARRVAVAYRQHLRAANPTICDALDATLLDLGQVWIVPRPVVWDDTDAITTGEAAELVGKTPADIRRWASDGLLPRFGQDGRSRTYLAGDVRAAAHTVTSRLTYRPHPPPDV
jgi:hypothetical protein